MLSTCLMYASLHASTKDSYYHAYTTLNAALAQPGARFNAATVRAAALGAFDSERRHASSTSRAPGSVLAFPATFGSRGPAPGTVRPGPSCCACPHHCVLADGSYRPVRLQANSADVDDDDREFCSGASKKTVAAYQAFQAGYEAGAGPDEMKRLGLEFEARKVSDKERAYYNRHCLQEEAVRFRTPYINHEDSDDELG